MSDVDTRVEYLERRLTNMIRATTIGFIALVSGIAYLSTERSTPTTPTEMRVRKLEIEDPDGTVRLRATSDRQDVGFELLDKQGSVRAALHVEGGVPVFSLWGEQSEARIQARHHTSTLSLFGSDTGQILAAASAKGSEFSLSGSEAKVSITDQIELTHDKSGTALNIRGSEGEGGGHAAIGLFREGNAYLSLNGPGFPDDTTQLFGVASAEGAQLSLNDRHGEKRFEAKTDKRGTRMSVLHRDGLSAGVSATISDERRYASIAVVSPGEALLPTASLSAGPKSAGISLTSGRNKSVWTKATD